MTMQWGVVRAFATLLAFCLAANANAGIIYDNLGTTDPRYNTTTSFSVGGPDDLGDTSVLAFGFEAATSGFVESIEVAVAFIDNTGQQTSGSMTFVLVTGIGDFLESINVTSTTNQSFGGAVETGLASGTTFLTAGELYFLVAQADSWHGWMFNNTGDVLLRALSVNGGPFAFGPTIASAFRINSVEVAEPGSLGLMTGGLLWLFGRILRRRSPIA